MNLKPFQNAEREFLILKGQLATHRIARTQYDTALEKLGVRDEYGRAWRMEPENGEWQLKVGETWVAANPNAPPPPPQGTTSGGTTGRSNNLIPILAIAGALGVCLCFVLVYAALSVLDILPPQARLFGARTPTQVVLLATSTPDPTDTPTTTVEPTEAETETPTQVATPGAGTPLPTLVVEELYTSLDADFAADPCPLFEGSNETRDYGCDLGEYYMLHKQATTRYTFYDVQYDDAVIEANGYVNSGAGKYEYGLVFRANTEGTLYYVFTVTNDGKYNVSLYKDDKYTDLIPYTASSAVRTGGSDENSFKVVMRGAQFDFYLNGQYLDSVINTAISSGVAGLFFYNAEPDTEVGFSNFKISTFTPPLPTATPDSGLDAATPTPQSGLATVAPSKPGVYVNSLRFSPGAPRRGEPVTFFVSFTNSTGKAQSYKWLVEIWEANADKKNPYGQADGLDQGISAGTVERATGDSWKVAGGGPCVPFRARVVYQDDQSRRVPFKRTNGSDLWVPFQVCP